VRRFLLPIFKYTKEALSKIKVFLSTTSNSSTNTTYKLTSSYSSYNKFKYNSSKDSNNIVI